MVGKILIFIFLLSLTISAQAVSCYTPNECTIYSKTDGTVMFQREKGIDQLFKDENTVIYSTYITKRNNQHLLVRETNGNNKSFIIVPLEISNDSISLSRIIFLSINMMASTAVKHEVWSGREFALEDKMLLNNFSWEIAFSYQGKVDASMGKKPTICAMPEGFSYMNVSVYDKKENSLTDRIYVYPKKGGVTPDSLSCIAGCLDTNDDVTEYVGSVGQYPISIHIAKSGSSVSGIYRYYGRGRYLYITGTISGDRFFASEFSDENLKNKTGEFDGMLINGKITGRWRSASGKRTHSFFLIPANI